MLVYLDLLIIFIGVVTYIFRNKPNPFIGVRFGYTYLSKKAWKRANTFAGISFVLLGILLTVLDVLFKLSKTELIAVMLAGISITTVATYKIAKETYEIEDLSKPIEGEPKALKKVKVKSYFLKLLLIQILILVIYLVFVAMLWDKLPNSIATNFNIYGKPNGLMSKTNGVLASLILPIGIPILTILLYKEPMLSRFPVYGKSGFRAVLTLLTLLQAFCVILAIVVLLYNAKMIELGTWFSLFIFGFLIFIVVWTYAKMKSQPSF